MKRVRNFSDGPLYMKHKDLAASDPLHPASPDEHVVKLWCPYCEILYDHETKD